MHVVRGAMQFSLPSPLIWTSPSSLPHCVKQRSLHRWFFFHLSQGGRASGILWGSQCYSGVHFLCSFLSDDWSLPLEKVIRFFGNSLIGSDARTYSEATQRQEDLVLTGILIIIPFNAGLLWKWSQTWLYLCSMECSNVKIHAASIPLLSPPCAS